MRIYQAALSLALIYSPSWAADAKVLEAQAKQLASFREVIVHADRIVIRDGGFDCCGVDVSKQKVLGVIRGKKAVAAIAKKLQFTNTETWGDCDCCGYPGMDWYIGRKRIALTSIQHEGAIRWKGFKGDAPLKRESRRWITEWLVRHKIIKKPKSSGTKGGGT